MEIKSERKRTHTGDADAKLPGSLNTLIEHGNEIEQIISGKPSFIVHWGTLFLFLFMSLAFLIMGFIQYPDIVTADGFLSSINAPKQVIAKTDGKLIKLLIKENQTVKENEILGYIESTANHKEVLALSDDIDSVTALLQNNKSDEVHRFSFSSFNDLGELQNSFQAYIRSLQQFENYLSGGFYIQRKKMLTQDISLLTQIRSLLLQQRSLLTEDLQLADSTLKSNEILKNEKVIAAFEYRSERSKMLSKQIALPEIGVDILSNENLQHEKLKEIYELENQIEQQKDIFIQSLNTFKSNMYEWKKKYLLIAPVDGKVSFATFLQENQQLKAAQLVCFINPGNAGYYLEVRIPQYNFGKVKTGQKVYLKFQAYPYQEFGYVQGEINSINNIVSDSGYMAKVILSHGLQTNYNKQVQYRTGLTVQADIITSNKTLLERLIQNIINKTSR